jgi:hypothetical protein
MKTTLLLPEETETTRLMLRKDVAFDESPVRETEAHTDCNCDRWGHPCPGCVNRDIVPKAITHRNALADQLLERLILFEFGDVVDCRSRDVQ